jgi:hypothetical protein
MDLAIISAMAGSFVGRFRQAALIRRFKLKAAHETSSDLDSPRYRGYGDLLFGFRQLDNLTKNQIIRF